MLSKTGSWLRRIGLVLAVCIVLGVLAPILLSVFSTGTDIKVGHIDARTPFLPSTAVPYTLPETFVVVKSKTVVIACKDTQAGEEIHGTTTLSLAAETEPDPRQQYFLYFDSGSHAKNLSYEVNSYANGALKSVNATIRDQVAPMTAAVAGGLLKVLIAPAAPPLAGAAGPPPVKSHCAELNKEIASRRSGDLLTLTQTNLWLPDAGDGGLFRIQVDLDRLASRFHLSAPRWSSLNANLRLETFASGGSDSPAVNFVADKCAPGEPCKPPLANGLVLRNGVHAHLSSGVCDQLCATLPRSYRPESLSDGPSLDVVLPQLGSLFLVRVHSGYAQDAGIVVELDPAGMITRLQSVSTNSLGDNISAILKNAGKD